MMNNNTSPRTIWLISLTGGKSAMRFALVPATTEAEAHAEARSWASVRGRRDIVWNVRRTEASWKPPTTSGEAGLAEHAERARQCETYNTFNTARDAWAYAARIGLRF